MVTTHGSLASVTAKFGQAEEHYKLLYREIHEAGFAAHFEPLRCEPNSKRTKYRFYIGEVRQPDPAWSLLVGDCMYNLRCALDHLVYQLHVRHFNGVVKSKIAKRTGFPIFAEHPRIENTSDLLPSKQWPEIGHLPVRDRALVKQLQPYVRRDDHLRYTRLALGRLAYLHNRDKHRDIHVAVTSAEAFPGPHLGREYGFRRHCAFGPLESHAEVDVWTFAKPAPPDVEVDHAVAVVVAIQERDTYPPVLTLLEHFLNGVRSAISRFADRFPDDEWPTVGPY